MHLLYFKALHIIFVVSWFAGLFYVVRLLIYHREALEKPEPDRTILINQYKIMASRLWHIITWPASILALFFGLSLLQIYGAELPGWLMVKLILVFLLFIYHALTYRMFRKLNKGELKLSSTQLRIWNEVATLFLFSIVFLVILKNSIDMLKGTIGLLGLAVILMLAIKSYKKRRTLNKRNEHD